MIAKFNGSLLFGVSHLQAKEREAWSAKRETKIRGLEDWRTHGRTFILFESSRAHALLMKTRIQEQFLHKQSLEMTGLTKRIVSGREAGWWHVIHKLCSPWA